MAASERHAAHYARRVRAAHRNDINSVPEYRFWLKVAGPTGPYGVSFEKVVREHEVAALLGSEVPRASQPGEPPTSCSKSERDAAGNMKVIKPIKVPILTRVTERSRNPELHVAAMLGFPLASPRASSTSLPSGPP